MKKSLKIKIQKIKNHKYRPKDFIIADAKDGDLAGHYNTRTNKKFKRRNL